jgi:hypothetical protein
VRDAQIADFAARLVPDEARLGQRAVERARRKPGGRDEATQLHAERIFEASPHVAEHGAPLVERLGDALAFAAREQCGARAFECAA